LDVKRAISSIKLFGNGQLAHPQYLIFFVTSKCVGRCRHCFYWEHINQDEKLLGLDEVEKIADSMGNILQITFTGGEPFLRDDFPELVKILHRKNNIYHIGIATSGFMPDKIYEGTRTILKDCEGANVTVGLPIEGPKELNDHLKPVK